MTVTTRRRFVKQAALSTAALCVSPNEALAAARNAFGACGYDEIAPDPAAVRKLTAQIAGRVITPDASEYQTSRLIFNRAFDLHPAVMVRCANSSDVARTLEFAQSQKVPLAVHGGGH